MGVYIGAVITGHSCVSRSVTVPSPINRIGGAQSLRKSGSGFPKQETEDETQKNKRHLLVMHVNMSTIILIEHLLL